VLRLDWNKFCDARESRRKDVFVMSKLRRFFKKLVQLQNYISKFGVAIQNKVVQQSLTDTLNGMAEAMKEEQTNRTEIVKLPETMPSVCSL